jgi:hypothetical protein
MLIFGFSCGYHQVRQWLLDVDTVALLSLEGGVWVCYLRCELRDVSVPPAGAGVTCVIVYGSQQTLINEAASM